MSEADGIPQPVIDAVLAFVNASETDRLKELVRTQREHLLKASADSVFEQLIAQHRDDAASVSFLRSRRLLLSRCREYGIDEAFSAKKSNERIERIVTTFANTRETSDLMKFVTEHEAELLSKDAEAILSTLIEQYKDEQTIQDFLTERRKLLLEVRRKGVAKAFSKEIITVQQPLGDAVAALMTAGSMSSQRQVLTENQDLLLTDDAEELISFIANGISTSDSQTAKKVRARLALLRRCRAKGLEAVFDHQAHESFTDALTEGTPQPEATPPGVDLDAELLRELKPLHQVDGGIAERDLRDLFERRPELVEPFRKLAPVDSIWLPTPDRREIQLTITEMRLAEASGDWSRVIEIGSNALRAASYDIDTRAAALVHLSLGTALSRTPHGNRAENLDRAIEHHELARNVFSLALRN